MGMVAAGLAIVSGISSIRQGKAAEKQAKSQAAETERLARQNAANIEAETMEQKRRAELAAKEQESASRAKAAASGIATDTESSMDIFMGAERDKFQKEIDWLVKSGESQASLALQQGVSAANQLRAQGKAARKSGITSALGSFASAGMGLYNGGFLSGGLGGAGASSGYGLGQFGYGAAYGINPFGQHAKMLSAQW